MRTTDIRHVLEVVRTGSLRQAAEGLFVAVPTLSEAVQRVERELGVELFTRTNRGMTLTEQGEALIDHLESLVKAEDALREAAQPGGAEIRIGCPQGAWFALIERAGPMLDGRTRTSTISTGIFEPIEALFDGTVHFALLPAPSDHDGLLTRRPLFTESRIVTMSAARAGQAKQATLEEIDAHPWMGRPRSYDAAYTATHRCEDIRGGPPPHIGPYHSNPLDIGAAMAAGDFIVAGTHSIANLFNLEDRGVTSVEISDAPPWQVDLVSLDSKSGSLPISCEEVFDALAAAVPATAGLELID